MRILLTVILVLVLLVPISFFAYSISLHCLVLPYIPSLSLLQPSIVYAGISLDQAIAISPDSDGDCLPDVVDNCRDEFNPRQKDSDENAVGDICTNLSNCTGKSCIEDLIKEDLKSRLSLIDASEIEISGTKDVVWNYLCMYEGVCSTTVNGYIIQANYNGVNYWYETSDKREIHYAGSPDYIESPRFGDYIRWQGE